MVEHPFGRLVIQLLLSVLACIAAEHGVFGSYHVVGRLFFKAWVGPALKRLILGSVLRVQLLVAQLPVRRFGILAIRVAGCVVVGLVFENRGRRLSLCHRRSAVYSDHLVLAADEVGVLVFADPRINDLFIDHHLHSTCQRGFPSCEQVGLQKLARVVPLVLMQVPVQMLRVMLLVRLRLVLVVVLALGDLLIFIWYAWLALLSQLVPLGLLPDSILHVLLDILAHFSVLQVQPLLLLLVRIAASVSLRLDVSNDFLNILG